MTDERCAFSTKYGTELWQSGICKDIYLKCAKDVHIGLWLLRLSSIRQHKATSSVIISRALSPRVVFEDCVGVCSWDLHDLCCVHVLLAGRWVLSVWNPFLFCFWLLSVIQLILIQHIWNVLSTNAFSPHTICIKVRLPRHTSVWLSRELLHWKLFKRSLKQISHPNPPNQN